MPSDDKEPSKEADTLFEEGLQFYLKKSYTDALWTLEAASDLGSGDADCHLGLMYELGEGVNLNLPRAFRFFQQSAQRGSSGGQYRLGRCYQEGLGVEIDKKEALFWHRKAAAQDNRLAPYSIAKLESEGIE